MLGKEKIERLRKTTSPINALKSSKVHHRLIFVRNNYTDTSGEDDDYKSSFKHGIKTKESLKISKIDISGGADVNNTRLHIYEIHTDSRSENDDIQPGTTVIANVTNLHQCCHIHLQVLH
ncbi:unnamed protein product [Adineta ricciae]|uniref:Uncharacterized protein n=1 Tax=Adineta ricciae TaxID=249248 RepID=A0A814NQY3_ADIRI|nr:unnamed protein product [Adineta ricciae]